MNANDPYIINLFNFFFTGMSVVLHLFYIIIV